MKNMTSAVLGIDTSNYTTSAALFIGGEIVQSKRVLPVAQGARGLRQSEALFAHIKQLPELIGDLFLHDCSLRAVGVSTRPETREDSYMPCFLAGAGIASGIASSHRIPLHSFSHQQGHIAAALYAAERLELLNVSFLAFHLSGGTTEALLVSPDVSGLPLPQITARSLDLKAGQAIDRVGVMLGLPFPCGPHLETMAAQCSDTIVCRPVLRDGNCSLSGIENQCAAFIKQERPQEWVAKFCLESIFAAVDGMCAQLVKMHPNSPILFFGGVSANQTLKHRMTQKYGAIFSSPAFSADNAAGVAVLASRMEG